MQVAQAPARPTQGLESSGTGLAAGRYPSAPEKTGSELKVRLGARKGEAITAAKAG